MTRLKSSDYAKFVGVSRQAISHAIKTGRVVRDDDGLIDTEYDLNMEYAIAANPRAPRGTPVSMRGEVRAAIPHRRKPKGVPHVAQMPSLQDSVPTKAEADVRKVMLQSEHLKIRLAEKLGLLIDRDYVDSIFVALESSILDNLAILGTRLTPHIAGIAKIEDHEIKAQIQTIIDKEMERSIVELKRVMSKALP